VYWPQYRVAGTIRDIIDRFSEAGVTQVQGPQGQPGTYRLIISS
jgi:hypothetical protein